MKKRLLKMSLTMVASLLVVGCGRSYKPVTGIPQVSPHAKMKVFSADGSNKKIGRTTSQDNAKENSVKFVGTYIPGLNIQTAVLNAENTLGLN